MIRQLLHLAALAFVAVVIDVVPLAAQSEFDSINAPPEGVEVGDIVDFSCLKLREHNRYGCRDRAFLVKSDGSSYAGLLVITNEVPEGEVYTYYPDVVLIGSRPLLDVSENGDVSLWGTWPGAGRSHWTTELTFIWNGSGLSISSYELKEWDGVTAVHMTCTLDISEGTYRVEHEMIALEALISHYEEMQSEPPPDLIRLKDEPSLLEGRLHEILSNPQDWSYPRPEPWPCNEAQTVYYEHISSVEHLLEDMRSP